LDFLEERYPQYPMYPSTVFERAKCRELIQHLELNAEWVARRLYKESFFGGSVSEETKQEVKDRLFIGLKAVKQLARFSPYIFGSIFTAADCVAYVHFVMIEQSTVKIYGDNMLQQVIPNAAEYMAFMDTRPHIQTMMADRDAALTAFNNLQVKYDG
jgi:glutathione S-transferase